MSFFKTITLFTLLFTNIVNAQKYDYKLKWINNGKENISGDDFIFFQFEGANYSDLSNPVPVFIKNYFVSSDLFEAQLTNVITEKIPDNLLEKIDLSQIQEDFIFTSNLFYERKKPVLTVELYPIRKRNRVYERIISFSIEVTSNKNLHTPKTIAFEGMKYSANSVLSSGMWKKIKISQTGIYKLTYAQISSMGFQNPQNIKVYGNGGDMLPYYNNVSRIDDIEQIPIYIYKGSDGIFNDGDYILFYCKAPIYWTYNSTEQAFLHSIHNYSDESYYFLTDEGGPATPMTVIDENSLSSNLTVSAFDDYAYHELESINLIKSGRMWLGESFDNSLTQTFTYSFPNMVNGSNLYLQCQVYSRAAVTNSYSFSINSQNIGSQLIAALNYSSTGNYAIGETFKKRVTNTFNNAITLDITYNKPAQGGEGWLNYFDINVRRSLIFTGGQMPFRDIQSVALGNVSQFQLSTNNPNTVVWEVTNPISPSIITSSINNNILRFIATTDHLREFIAFDGTSFYTPTVVGDVANQNLHGLNNVDMVIISHPDFLSVANEIADIHRQYDNLTVEVVTPDAIYNEFSSGMKDISAIKFFMKMLYDRAGTDSLKMPKYLLLVGDGSYDNRHSFSQNTNFIPTYQSVSSLAPTSSFTTDDYYGLLDDNEYEYVGKLDIGVGRLPIKSLTEANAVLKKIKNYYSSVALGDWRNWLTFVADDEDANEHIGQSNALATEVDTLYPQYNNDKIFLDAFQQESTPTGDRYPGAHDAIAQRISKGSLVFNYTGHGNEYALSHEHVIINSDIVGWTNFNKLPLFITGTCEFSHWDNYNLTSAGELILLNPIGGSIALFSTTRLVYSTSNFALHSAFFDYLYARNTEGNYLALGDIYRLAKNKTGGLGDINKRNFSLLGDPAMKLSYPKHIVLTDSINGISISTFNDTIKPLEKVTLKGHIENAHAQLLDSYTGTVVVTVFDKPVTIYTLANDGGNQYPFSIQNNILFRGQASVQNGRFRLEFILPKDILYTSGHGKISYYAYPSSGTEDATGYYKYLNIGGETGVISDNQGPQINLYMNDEKFVNGGITNESPILIAKFYDDNGINTVSSSIGHDICAYLDNDVSKKVVLNDNYLSDKDNYKKGTATYNYSDLETGEHTLTVKAWDVANNSSETSITFTVKSSANVELSHILNYPNPFSNKTSFYFEHNQPSNQIEAMIQIFSISGRLVKTIQSSFYAEGFRSTPIEWDGRDDYGDKLAQGVYFYKISVKTDNGSSEKFEKLVILK